MRSIVVTFFLIILSTSSNSQDFAWAKSIGGTGYEHSHNSIFDQSGNSYTIGNFNYTVDFDPNAGVAAMNSSGNEDVFITKLDASGNLIWAKSFGGAGSDYGISIVVDNFSNIYAVGNFSSTVDFDPGIGTSFLSSTSNSRDVFILKLNAQGNLIWAKKIGGAAQEDGREIATDNLSNVYVTGFFEGTADFNPGAGTHNLSANNRNAFILKLDSLGDFVWAKELDGTYQSRGFAVAADNAGNVYSSGMFNGTVDFDPGTNINNISSSSWDNYIVKLDVLGNFKWVKKIGSSGWEQSYDLAIDQSGFLYNCGNFDGLLTFNTSPSTSLSSSGNFDIYITKLDTAGNFIWANKIGGSSVDFSYTVTVGTDANVYLSGSFSNTVDFDPASASSYNLSSTGGQDAFISKFDSSGSFIWARGFGGPGNDEAFGVAVNNQNNVFTNGHFNNTADLNPDPSLISSFTSNGFEDVFLIKLTQCTNSSSVFSETACDSYTSPSGKYTWSTSGVYTDTIQNVGGCDSTMIINLTINESTREVLFVNTCNSYTSPSGKYNWSSSGTYRDTIQNSIGCDSVLVIGLVINPNSSSSISPTACISYTSPSGKYNWTNSGTYHDTLQSATGCDSIININLTVKHVDTSVTVNQNILISNANTASYQWINCNTGPITGETNKSLTVTADGSYAVIVSQNNCSDTSTCIPVIVSGIDEHQSKTSFKIYPNPSSGKIYIESKGISSIEILSITGKMLRRISELKDEKTAIDLSNLNNGIYFVRLIVENGSFNKKLVLTN